MMRFPNEQGTLVVLTSPPLIWPVRRTHILCQWTAKNAEVVVKMLPSRAKEVSLRYRNGARVTLTSCPLTFDNEGDATRRYYKMAVSWHGGSVTLAAGGSIIAATGNTDPVTSEKVIMLKSEEVLREGERTTPISEGATTRGLGKVQPVPEAFYPAKEELERAGRQMEILRTGRHLTEIADAWKAFLDAFVQTRNKILWGAHAIAASEAEANTWSGVFEARRRDSALLTYMHHARNAHNHGVGAILGKEQAKLHFRSNGVTHIKSMLVTKDGLVVEFEGTPPSIAISPRMVVAVPVTDERVTYHPPEGKIGLYQLAQGGLAFLEEWLESGASSFG